LFEAKCSEKNLKPSIEALADRLRRQVMEAFNAIAPSFNQVRRRPWDLCFSVTEGLGLNASIIDVGSGNGRHAIPLAEKGFEVVGVDFAVELNKILADKARRLGLWGRLHVVAADACSLPFKEACFDGALNLATIHHIPFNALRVKAVRESLRVLKKGGRLIISAWSRWQPRFTFKLLKSLLKKLLSSVAEYGDVYVPWSYKGKKYVRFYHLFNRYELRKLLEAGGFNVERVYAYRVKARFFAENVAAIAIKT